MTSNLPERPGPLPEGPRSRAWRRADRLVLLGGFLAIWVPAALLLAGVKARPIENRPLATIPALTLDGLADGSWPRGVNAYLEDNVAVRSLAVRLRGEAYIHTGGTGTAAVVVGRNDWLFPRNALDPSCTHAATDIAAALDHAATLAAAGITFRFVALPDKQTIYPGQVGLDPFPPACTDAQRPALRAAIASHAGIAIDGWSLLESAAPGSGERLLYYPHDTHWTPLGAEPVVGALVSSLDRAAWDPADVTEQGTSRHSGDLARQIGVTRYDRVTKVVVRPDVTVTRTDVAVPFELRNEPSVFETTTATDRPVIEGRTMIVYDSFFGTRVDMLGPYFRDAVWVHIGDLQQHPEIARMLGPFKTVVVQRVERFLYLDDLDAVVRAVTP